MFQNKQWVTEEIKSEKIFLEKNENRSKTLSDN